MVLIQVILRIVPDFYRFISWGPKTDRRFRRLLDRFWQNRLSVTRVPTSSRVPPKTTFVNFCVHNLCRRTLFPVMKLVLYLSLWTFLSVTLSLYPLLSLKFYVSLVFRYWYRSRSLYEILPDPSGIRKCTLTRRLRRVVFTSDSVSTVTGLYRNFLMGCVLVRCFWPSPKNGRKNWKNRGPWIPLRQFCGDCLSIDLYLKSPVCNFFFYVWHLLIKSFQWFVRLLLEYCFLLFGISPPS